jgi:hypothetical protein
MMVIVKEKNYRKTKRSVTKGWTTVEITNKLNTE